MHLEGMVEQSRSNQCRAYSGKENWIEPLAQTRNSLNQARQDAIKLVNTPLDQLQNPASTRLLDDLVLQANNAYIGLYDPQTGHMLQRKASPSWLCGQPKRAYRMKPIYDPVCGS